ncbi:Armadillo-type protein [Madurella fahalii]|uniref:Armadillo-type protein n=1 Tax=Madurella fahalii TaxID=1157608 RepID=A0ABQ0GE12_9PEZI
MTHAQYPSRPTATDDLALVKEMIKIFRDDRRPSHVPEAAALTPITTVSSYQDLSRAFGNAVIHGTADGNILEHQILEAFVSVLRCAGGNKTADLELGSVLKSLQTRLKAAVDQADPISQYRLIRTLSSVLDALIDTKTAGLSREELHEPLLKQLGTLSEERELRLAQAACYAHQALLGIPNDESPYRALWRNMQPVIGGVAKVAGAVPTMDPAKLFDGLMQLADLPALVRSMVDVANAVSGLVNSLGGAAEAVKLRQKQKSWYVALRFTDMLLEAKAFSHLEKFIKTVPCRSEKEFLCGLYAQLELAWKTEDRETEGHKHQIVQLFDQVLVPIGCESRHRRVYEWVKLVADTLGQPHWKSRVQLGRGFRWPWREEYTDLIHFQEPKKDALPADLLNEAWKRCFEAQVFYADIEVRKHYLENDEELLKIERLSGDRLPMEQCYINLAVVEQVDVNASHSEQADPEQADPEQADPKRRKSSPFSLPARLKVKTPSQDKKASIHSLLDVRKRQDGTEAPSQRILIRGQAGVGKTTLCKRIVYNYLHEGVWTGMFDRLFWVPLRTLKAKLPLNPAYNLEQWLHDEYFRAGDGDKLARALAEKVDDPGQRSRTLFVLDGLDEVSRELDSETPGLLHDLLKQPRVIVTSRPSGLNLAYVGRVDLELETIGFDQDQVKSYIKMAAGMQASEIEAFLQGHSLLQDLVRIPIQLEALCYCWDVSMNSQGAPTTITALYRRIESKLWKKDAARLEKPHEGKPLAEDTAKRMLDSDIAWKAAPEHSLLCCLAFTGLCSDVIEFDQINQNEILGHWGRGLEGLQAADARPSCLSLAKISFLRSSDAASDPGNRSYHFLHLTFQEFFAAQYFVEHWISGRKLDVPNLGPSSPETEPTAEVFLRKEKYKARYDVFWRFVAGLLHEKRDDGQLCRFFHTIDNEPRDLLGPTHQRLVMHCLNEVPSNKSMSFARLRTGFEKQLSGWVLFECSFRDRSSLASEMELPEQVLEDAIREGSEDAKVKILFALRKVSATAIELLPNWLKDGVSAQLQVAALSIPQPLKGLPPTTLEPIIDRLQDEHGGVRRAAVKALARQGPYSPEVLEAILGRLQDKDSPVRQAAVEALASQVKHKPAVHEAIAGLLVQDEDVHVRLAAVTAFADQAKHSPAILEAILDQFQDYNEEYREEVVSALSGPAAYSPAVLKMIIGGLDDWDKGVRRVARETLVEEAARSSAFLKTMISMLRDENRNVRRAIIDALEGQATHSPEALEAILGQLQDKESPVRQIAVKALGRQAKHLPAVHEAIAGLLVQDEDIYIQLAIVEAFVDQTRHFPKILEAIIDFLQNEDEFVRRTVFQAITSYAKYSPESLEAMISRLQNEHRSGQRAIVEVLLGLPIHSPEVFETIINWLQDEDWLVRQGIVKSLARQTEPSPKVLDVMIGQLQDENSSVRRTIVEALTSYIEYSSEVLDAIIGRLQDEHREVRMAAVEALAGPAVNSPEVLEGVIGLLQDEDILVQQAVVQALARQAEDSPYIFEAIIGRLQDKDWPVRQATVKILLGQTEYSPEALPTVIGLLQNENGFVREAVTRTLVRQAKYSPEVVEAIIGLLQDEYKFVQRAAIDTLVRQAEYSPEFVEAIIGLLQDKDVLTRQAVTEALVHQAEYSSKVLEAIIGRLQDEDWLVRHGAIKTLLTQAKCSPEALKAIISLLQDEDQFIRRAAIETLTGLATLSPDILIQNAESLYKYWLERSFDEHCSLYVDDEFYIDMPEWIRTVSSPEADRFRDAIQKAQETLGILELERRRKDTK